MVVRITRHGDVASLSSYVHTMISMAHSATVAGRKPFVDWFDQPVDLYRNAELANTNQWEWWFEQPAVFTDEELQLIQQKRDTLPKAEYWEPRWRQAWGNHEMPIDARSTNAVNVIRNVIPKYLKFRKPIVDRAESILQKYQIKPTDAVAVSVRGTDSRGDSLNRNLRPLEAFFNYLDTRMQQDKPTLWVKCEEQADADRMRERYPSAIFMDEFCNTTQGKKVLDMVSPKSGIELGNDIAAMIYLFSRFGTFVRNSGNLSDLAAGFSVGKLIVTI